VSFSDTRGAAADLGLRLDSMSSSPQARMSLPLMPRKKKFLLSFSNRY
jgi:hypothetical protein